MKVLRQPQQKNISGLLHTNCLIRPTFFARQKHWQIKRMA